MKPSEELRLPTGNITGEQRHAPWWSVLAVFVASLLMSGMALWIGQADNRRSERKHCSVVAQNRATEEGKYQAYALNPPTTATGEKQRQEVKISYDRYVTLERELGCTPPVPGSRE